MSGVVVWPILYASIAYYMLGERGARLPALGHVRCRLHADVVARRHLLQRRARAAALAGDARSWSWPPPFRWPRCSAPITVGGGLIGIYSIGATLPWGWAFFDVPGRTSSIRWPSPSRSRAALAFGMLGLIMASTFILYRAASSWESRCSTRSGSSAACCSRCRCCPAPRTRSAGCWRPTGGERHAAVGAGGTRRPDLGMCVLLSLAYLAIGATCLAAFEYAARSRGSLRLT